jgi:hypothetical protein
LALNKKAKVIDNTATKCKDFAIITTNGIDKTKP